MNAAATHRLRSHLRALVDPAAVLIGIFAVTTISLATILHATGLSLADTGFGTRIDYTTSPVQHVTTQLLVAVLLASLAYMVTTDPGMSVVSFLQNALIGIVLAVGISFVTTGSWLDTSYIIETLTLRPSVTGLAIVAALSYYTLLHTQYDWMAINIAGLALVPPIITRYAGYSLTLLASILVVTAVVDYIAVHRSSAMKNLASGLLSLRLPVAFLVPTSATSLTEVLDKTDDEEWVGGVRLFGMGDVAIPGIFIVAVSAQYTGIIPLPVIGALIGYLIGYAVLICDPFENIAYAALPFLNTGVLLGVAVTLPFV